jgi:hypothetical protein
MYHLIFDETKLELKNYLDSLSVGGIGNASNSFRLVQDLMPRVVPFIGRTQILEQIREEMKTKQIVVLAAYGGTGKSTLANEFGHKYAENKDNKDRVSILIHCETRDKVYGDLKKMALLLEMDISNKAIGEKLAFYVRAKLTELDQSFLFILDNVEKYEDIDAFLQEFGQFKSDKCKFLMTTRDKNILENRDFQNDQKCALTIDSFDLEEANEYVQENFKEIEKLKNLSDEERENVISLAKYEHKILPLKLKLTVNYIKDNLEDFECLNDCVEFIRTQSWFIQNNPNDLLEDSKDEWTVLNNLIKHLNSSLTIIDRSVTNDGSESSEKIDLEVLFKKCFFQLKIKKYSEF